VSARVASLAVRAWRAVPTELLPFADAVEGLPLGRLLRLALVQVSVGMALTLLNGTLNRVMIVELGVPAWQVSIFIALPLVLAPVRALFGFKSDTHKSAFGWRRVPFIWMGTLALFGGLALTPMSLLLMSGVGAAPAVAGQLGALLAFFLIGIGIHMSQTAGLALACDLAPEDRRPRVVALLYVALLLAMLASSLAFGAILDNFTPRHLFAAVSGAALVAVAFNLVALWKQEGRHTAPPAAEASISLAEAWRAFDRSGRARRLLVAVALVTAGFNMQDVLLEPYGGEILHLSVSATTMLTAIWAAGSLAGFGIAARRLKVGVDPSLCAAQGILIGIPGFSAVIFSGALDLPLLFRLGALLIGIGGGLASVSLLSAATGLAEDGRFGFAVGAWGAAQALSAGIATAVGGALRDAARDLLPPALHRPDAAYAIVYHLEIALLFGALVALGPLATRVRREASRFALPEFPA
jgi:BCD family chlorophyll transporter-like MFS transporter